MKAEKKAERLKSVVLDAQMRAARKVQGLYKEPGEDGYNADAASTWNECSVATRAAIELTKGTMALERAKAANGAEQQRAFGLVILPARAGSLEEWEAKVKGRKVIDTTAGQALIEEKK